MGPEQIAAAREALASTKPGRRRTGALSAGDTDSGPITETVPQAWVDSRGLPLFPLDLPEIHVDPGVFVPTQGSLLLWKYLYREDIGAKQRCIDIGCGSGLLTVQLARNGAAHVRAIDIDQAAVDNTLLNAFRNGVAGRVSATAVDLFPWVPEERYDVIVASLYQMPVDPFEQVSTHRPLDYWGRNLLDHLISLLPDALADDGVAYIMQLSIIGQQQTVARLSALGYSSRVVDFTFFEFHDLFKRQSAQIHRVEELSDAYHLKFSDEDVMVAYLLEVRRAKPTSEDE